MTLMKLSPFRGMIDLQSEMNRLFSDYFSSTPERSENETPLWQPFVDIAETDDDIIVTADLPGMKKDDIKIVVQDNILTLQGEKKQETEDKKQNYHRVERVYGSFMRNFRLPSSVVVDKINAEYKDGVLNVVLPKSEEAKPKEVNIAIK